MRLLILAAVAVALAGPAMAQKTTQLSATPQKSLTPPPTYDKGPGSPTTPQSAPPDLNSADKARTDAGQAAATGLGPGGGAPSGGRSGTEGVKPKP